ncbi:MAG: hydroxyacid dehydrogenase [Dethiobacteria bacterium]|nr:hydroxyacid dehydrogenase [Bacillota bacterium]
MSKLKALVIDDIHPDGAEKLKKFFEVTKLPALNTEELAEAIEPYHLLMMRVSAFVGEKVLAKAKNLKVIASSTAGLSHVDLELCRQKNITVVNAPGGNVDSVVELTIGRMIDLARSVPQANYDVKNGTWDRFRYTGMELAGKKLGVVAFGKIGRRVAEIARFMGMEILAFDPYVSEEEGKKAGAKMVSLKELLRESDIITVHAPLTPDTKDLIDREELAMMKDGALLLNMGRGGVVNEDALYEALKSGKLGAAGFDVMVEEPCLESPLYELDNFIITPHIGGQTPEALRRMALIAADKAIEAFGFKED